jgi:hypothetical protein
MSVDTKLSGAGCRGVPMRGLGQFGCQASDGRLRACLAGVSIFVRPPSAAWDQKLFHLVGNTMFSHHTTLQSRTDILS